MSKEESKTGLEIAVIGMSGRFPAAKDIEQFWWNLKNGVESIVFFSEEELIEAGMDSKPITDPNYVKAFGILEDSEYFDSAFFEYTPSEAEIMDPQIRIFHECAWQALEDAGYCPGSYEGLIGLYAGASPNFLWEAGSLLSEKNGNIGQYAAAHLIDKDMLSLRVSYKLDLTGPAIALNTTCSTSLVALHLACQGLLNGECDMALAGGISVTKPRKEGYMYQEGMIMSVDGHCRAFDAKTKGVVGGNGAAIVVLKRLEDAAADRDTIHAVIKSSAINNDGIRKVGFTAPSVEGQAEVIKTALHMAEVEPETITYIETHGTGTALGDPVEIEGLKLAFPTDKKGICRIGSVKTNIGHLDSAAGVAGFIKTVLALKHKQIPPSLHFETPNPKIALENTPFVINRGLVEWKSNSHPLRAGVSSFGIGGTNAHVILEEALEGTKGLTPLHIEAAPGQGWDYRLILLSAKTPSALDRIRENLANHLKKHPGINLADAAYTLQVGRERFPYRKMLVCSTVEEAIELLSHESERIQSYFSAKDDEKKSIIFMFPGQGAQYVNMGLQLYEKEPFFREEMNRCFEILKPLMGYDLKEILYPTPPAHHLPPATSTEKINQTEVAQPVLFIIEYSLAKLLINWGISPAAMIGHSIGEYVAACLSGIFSLEDALKLVASRGKFMQEMPCGAMLGVPLPEEELKPLLDDEISLAAVNTPSLCVVSGPHDPIDAFLKKLKEKGCEANRLHTSHAFHSEMMEPMLERFEEKVKSIQLNKPKIPYISNVTGQWITDAEVKNPRYWTRHIRNAVRFSRGVNELLKKENPVFVEIGPGQTLSTLVRKHIDKKEDRFIINLIRHPQENAADDYYLLYKIGELWLAGIEIHWWKFYPGEKQGRIPLPTYSFDRYRYLPPRNPFEIAKEMLSKDRSLSRRKDPADWFYVPLWKQCGLDTSRSDGIPANPNILVFMDAGDFGSQLIKRLEQDGHHVIIVKVGIEFTKESEQVYHINPRESSDYETLFKELKQFKSIPSIIAHLWNVTDTRDPLGGLDFKEVENAQDLGFYSLLHIAQAIGKECVLDKIQMKVVTTNMHAVTGEEELCPGKSTLWGAVKVIPLEYSNIGCYSIDIVLPEPGTVKYKKLLDGLLSELTTITEPSAPLTAYRGAHRWVQIFEPIYLEKPKAVPLRLKKSGVYLITGGLGGIGLVLGENLAKAVQAKLILTSRSVFPGKANWKEWLETHEEENPVSRKIRKLQELENLGAEVMVLSADVSELQQMQEVVTQARDRFGQIDGVIHAAGVPDGALIQRRTRDTSEQIFKSKVKGTLVLHTIFSHLELDFLILCSSLASILSPLGQVGYCAASNFLDAFAYYKTTKDGVFTVSINWDSWQEVGMAVEALKHLNGVLKHGIFPAEGQEVFSRILGGEASQVVVSTGDLNARMKHYYRTQNDRTGLIPAKTLHQRPQLGVTYVAPKSNIEKIIANAWQEVLGLDKLGVDDNFFEIGGDSLKIIELNKKLKETLKKEIPVQLMFSYSTVRSLSRYLSQEETVPGLSDKEIEQSRELDHTRNMMKRTINKISTSKVS
jgi:acyl transferase domain-containing protein/acyl carrier protein